MKKFNEIMIILILFVASFAPFAIIINKDTHIGNITTFDYIIKQNNYMTYVEVKQFTDKYKLSILLSRLNETVTLNTYIIDDTELVNLTKLLNKNEIKQLDKINWFGSNYITIKINGIDIKDTLLSIDIENKDVVDTINNSIRNVIVNKGIKIQRDFRKNRMENLFNVSNIHDTQENETSEEDVKNEKSFSDILNIVHDIF